MEQGKVGMQKKIEVYFKQLTEGCGNASCENKQCCKSADREYYLNCLNKIPSHLINRFVAASKKLNPNEAAATALRLARLPEEYFCAPAAGLIVCPFESRDVHSSYRSATKASGRRNTRTPTKATRYNSEY